MILGPFGDSVSDYDGNDPGAEPFRHPYLDSDADDSDADDDADDSDADDSDADGSDADSDTDSESEEGPAKKKRKQ
jgi:hypothetical protein